MKKIMIFGAASAIAQETAKLFARDGENLFLVDMNIGRLEAVRDDILSRFKTKIEIYEMNALDFDKHQELFDKAIQTLGGLDAVLIAHGTLPDQIKTQEAQEMIIREFNINCVSVISLASIAANYFEKKKEGCIAVISSVAGDRGRQSNYIYGAAKGGVTTFLQGLRNRMTHSGVSVVTIKPGMVDTPMTAHLPKSPLFAKPGVVGKGIYKAMLSGKAVAYLPGYWRLIMFIIKMIPEWIFKKMKL
ncbi:MAG: short-chain dehydrogenase [Ignavibacteria bacterium GWB2_35_12]|nr:MAG: short-chain dehydrogenase [Ignavibacteria bacterium GWA2_35_8]OGU38381.1 MAG: short-chain dehydrogenase [Ignavibacteria bacterium GWB2_35_12]OGU94171.1 MAG: short-chain dehydrogenase [Ignavibacteria bacterium RIFOXYA2_FULL_35_10]OGV23382.1 MAG: short-chain dehydrogenase [Ignavibacteria bacterium RIFOXYC2_FULL_35_21]